MLNIRTAQTRGRTALVWLDSRHTFSFGAYYDPEHMGFGALRVINDDRVTGGGGFPAHPHRDMEIITYVLSGALAHEDSLGTGSVIRAGDVQRMSAGTGIRHSEFNASATEPVHFLQIWIEPESRGLAPSYEQKSFAQKDTSTSRQKLRLIGSRDGRDGSLTIHQDVTLYALRLDRDESAAHSVPPGRAAWIQVASGAAAVNGSQLEAGDSASVRDAGDLVVAGTTKGTEVLIFDLIA